MRNEQIYNCAFSFSIVISFSIFVLALGASQQIRCPQRVFVLGDSISDTGNSIRIFPILPPSRPPYGENFPGRLRTGRWSDGSLISDYTVTALGLPLLSPYLDATASFSNGVNFAVAGSTALDTLFYYKRGVLPPPVPSLRVQLNWYKKYLRSICSTKPDCANKLNSSIVFVGEIGFNDIGIPFTSGKSTEEIMTYVPLIVQAITNTTRDVVKCGASQVIVPGNFPLGCFAFALSVNRTQEPTAYDDLGCLKSVNNLTRLQNNLLQEALVSLRKEFPKAVILYADYYNAFQSVLRNASALGFNTTTLLKACCGVEGQFNPEGLVFCGNFDVPVCPNPNIYINWDGVHLTQETARRISKVIVADLSLNCTK